MLQERRQRTWSEVAREEGRLQGRIELLRELLESKFGPLDDSARSRLHDAGSQELRRWGARFVTAESLDDVFT